MTETSVECPGCGVTSPVDPTARSSEGFCPGCDFPLFWATARPRPPATGDAGAGLRRLPGAGGRQKVGWVTCPWCEERNPAGGTECIRCHKPFVIAPEPASTPDPPPVPPRVPEPPIPSMAWIYVAVLLVPTALLLFLLTQID